MAVRGSVSGKAVGAGGSGAAASMRNKFRQTLQQKTEQSYKTKDENASSFRDYFDKDKMAGIKKYMVPKGEKTVVYDVIPYFAGPRDPRNAEGEPVYVLDVNVHKNIGPMNDMIVCLAQYGKPCPICEEIEKRKAAEEDYNTRIKPLRATRRTVYNIIVRDNSEEEAKGVQIWEIAHFFIEKKIAGISKNPRTGGITVFSDPDDGKSISFTKRNPTKDTVEYSGHQFIDRPYPITDKELEGAYILDSLITILPYKEISDILYAEPEEGNSEADEENQPEEQTSTPEKQDPPARQKRERHIAKEEEKAPEPEQPGDDSGDVCPMGGEMGKNIDEFNECLSCELYDACSTLAESY